MYFDIFVNHKYAMKPFLLQCYIFLVHIYKPESIIIYYSVNNNNNNNNHFMTIIEVNLC